MHSEVHYYENIKTIFNRSTKVYVLLFIFICVCINMHPFLSFYFSNYYPSAAIETANANLN